MPHPVTEIIGNLSLLETGLSGLTGTQQVKATS